MIDALVTLFNGAMTLIALFIVIWAAASILTAVLSVPREHAVTDGWERRNVRRSR